MIKELRETRESESSEAKKLIQTLTMDSDKKAGKIVELEVKLTQVKCENRVCRKMVVKYDELVDGLRKQVQHQLSEEPLLCPFKNSIICGKIARKKTYIVQT